MASKRQDPQGFPTTSNTTSHSQEIIYVGGDDSLNLNISERDALRLRAAPAGSQQMFPGAQRANIHNSSITAVAGNMTTINPSSTTKRYKLLLANIAPGAFHNAAERGNPPKCHPRTRVAIRDELMQWIKDPSACQKFITWLYGPAGAGKTAIAQSIAEACAREGLLAASFFFGRTAAGRNTSAHFVATLAYQLSESIPDIKDKILAAIEKDPAIFSRSLSTQMQVLIVAPLASVQLTRPPRVVVVDGVDECGPNDEAHAELLKVLAAAVEALKKVPIIFLIGSRPEYRIRTAFSKYSLSSLTKSLALDNEYQPDKDIKTYFKSKFQEIRQEHLPLMSEPWPSRSDIAYLVTKASGQFIFAATVIKFIDNPRHDPKELLKIIRGLSCAGNETPFALLDSLYLFILGSVADIGKVLEVLTLILLELDRFPDLNMGQIEELLGFNIRRTLVDMHALVFVPLPTSAETRPRIHHASLHDFLMDRSRSLEYHIDAIQGHVTLCRRWLKVIGTYPRTTVGMPAARDAFVYHCRYVPPQKEIADDLASLDLRPYLKTISGSSFITQNLYNYKSSGWNNFFKCVKHQGGNREDVFPPLQSTWDLTILAWIEKYPAPLSTYIPILLLGFTEYAAEDVGNLLLELSVSNVAGFKTFRQLDSVLLDVLEALAFVGIDEYIGELFQDKARAGKYFVDGESHVALAKAIISVLCAKPRERHSPLFEMADINDPRHRCRNAEGSSIEIHKQDRRLNSSEPIALHHPDLFWFPRILNNASTDLDLAVILRDYAVQFRNDVQPMPGRRTIATESIRYMQRCGIPFLEHAHQPGNNECAICTLCEDSIIIENTPNIASGPPSISPLISESHPGEDGCHSTLSKFMNSAAMARLDKRMITLRSSYHTAMDPALTYPAENPKPRKRRRMMDLESLLC